MIKALMLLSLLLPLLPARAVRPAAWRAAQYQHVSSELLHPSRGPLTGAPPCLSSLTKSGRGHEASWSLGSYEAGGMCLQVSLALDRNPDEPCYKLLFNEAERGKMGHMLLAAGEQYSALRGMRIREDLRGCGYSKLLLSIWLEMCIRARLTPRTRYVIPCAKQEHCRQLLIYALGDAVSQGDQQAVAFLVALIVWLPA